MIAFAMVIGVIIFFVGIVTGMAIERMPRDK